MRDPDEQYLITEREGRDRDRYYIPGPDADTSSGSGPDFRDLTLKEEVGEALGFHEDIDASQVDVDAHNGVITLSGSVMSERERTEAEECASNIDGVITVINDIRIQTTSNR
ncbi:MAG: BON domain-containing protein [Bacteriovoracaceae bacterium]